MPRNRHFRLFHIDAFTRTPLTGNSAGVILDAESLSDAEMQAIASELRHSETAFLLPPDGDDHDLVVRFFTPRTEVPSCGHATLAAHYARGLVEHDGRSFSFSSLQGKAMGRPGRVRVDVMIEDGIPVGAAVGDEAVVVYEAELSLGRR